MQRAYTTSRYEPVSEMAIVDTFTRLIFEEGDHCTDRELLIIQAFREVDPSVMRDSHREMGEYLRNLGVREMIHLVSRLRENMRDDAEHPAADPVMLQGSAASRPGAAKR